MDGKIKSLREVCRISRRFQKKGKKIVFCHGFFDILHIGHITMLYEASKLGDILVVGVDHDESARKLKGPKRPINDHDLRMKLLTLLEPVDFVFLIPNIEYIKPDVFYVSKVYEELKPNIIASCVSSDDKGGLLRKRQSGAVGAEFVNIKHPFSGMSTTKLMEAFGFD